jgi:hypothetical protein
LQNCPAAEHIDIVLTPLQELEMQRLIAGSAISLLMNATTDDTTSKHTAVSVFTASTSLLSGSKHLASDVAVDSLPYLSKYYPDYSFTKSSANSVASGDDSNPLCAHAQGRGGGSY